MAEWAPMHAVRWWVTGRPHTPSSQPRKTSHVRESVTGRTRHVPCNRDGFVTYQPNGSMRLVSRTLFLSLLLAGACGTEEADPAPDAAMVDCATTGRYMELRTGASWTYQVDDGELTTKTQEVGPEEDVGGAKAGTTAFRLTTTKVGGMVVSWQQDTGDGIVRHRERDMAGSAQTDEIYSPYRTRLDETDDHTEVGATWTEEYTESVTDINNITTMVDKVETWEVEAVDEVVVVPAGAYCALRVRRTSTAGGIDGSDKTFWYARGIGKVKETGANQTEELVSYE